MTKGANAEGQKNLALAPGTGVLLLGATLRLWHLAELPPGLHHDEAFHLLRAAETARGEAWPVYITAICLPGRGRPGGSGATGALVGTAMAPITRGSGRQVRYWWIT